MLGIPELMFVPRLATACRNGALVAACVLAAGVLARPLVAAERAFDFSQTSENQAPPGFTSLAMGVGGPGEWRVVLDDAPSAFTPLSSQSPAASKRAVLAQLSRDSAGERFPILLWDRDVFRDFKFTVRFKTVRGTAEQMAGIVFRALDETNYYVLRASSLGNNVRFYKVVNGQRGPLYGPETPVKSGVWHELAVECAGNEIRCFFNGVQVIPNLTDSSFSRGKIGFWTKSDSVSYFTDAKVVYSPLESPAVGLVRRTLEKYPRLAALKIFVPGKAPGETRILASTEADVGQPGGDTEASVLRDSGIYYGRAKDIAIVTMPLRDRNGDTIAVARVSLKRFPGQTEQNAIERATPIVKDLQASISSMDDLIEPSLPAK